MPSYGRSPLPPPHIWGIEPRSSPPTHTTQKAFTSAKNGLMIMMRGSFSRCIRSRSTSQAWRAFTYVLRIRPNKSTPAEERGEKLFWQTASIDGTASLSLSAAAAGRYQRSCSFACCFPCRSCSGRKWHLSRMMPAPTDVFTCLCRKKRNLNSLQIQ